VSDDRTRVFTIAHVPQSLEKEWLQHLRDFDVAHPGCHFEVVVDAPHHSFHEIVQMLEVNPGIPLQAILQRKKPS
jgi:hypothetical protein